MIATPVTVTSATASTPSGTALPASHRRTVRCSYSLAIIGAAKNTARIRLSPPVNANWKSVRPDRSTKISKNVDSKHGPPHRANADGVTPDSDHRM